MNDLETKRLVLRQFTLDDWKDIHRLALDWSKAPGPAFDKWPTSTDETRKLTAYFAEQEQYRAVLLLEKNMVIGLVAFNGFDASQQLDLGHVFLAQYQDDDIDKEALTAAVDFAFENKGATAILTHNASEHHTQIAPLKSLGFKNINPEDPGEFVLTKEDWKKS